MSILRKLSLLLFILLVIAELFPVSIKNITLVLFASWVVVSYSAYPHVFRYCGSQKRYHSLLIFLLFYFLSVSIGKNLFQGVVSLLFMMRVVSPILMYDILRTCSTKTQRRFVSSLLVLFVIYSFWMFALIDRFGAELGIKNSIISAESEEHVDTAFSFIYSLPVLIVALLLRVRTTMKERRNKIVTGRVLKVILGLALLSGFTILVFKSLFMTAVVIIFIGVSMGLFYNKKGKNWIFKSAITLLLLIVAFITQYGRISQSVSSIGSESTNQRVSEIYSILLGQQGQTGDVNARQNLSMVSLGTFLKHPLFGANHLVGNNRYDNNSIGNHSEWLDMLALYGLFALLLFYFVYKSLKVHYLGTGELIPPLIFVLTGFLNPIFFFTINLAMFVIVPLLKSFDTQDSLV